MKKFIPVLGGLLASVPAFADGAISTPDGILSAGQTALDGLMTTALPIVGAIVVSGLTLWGAFKLLQLVKRAFGFGTGR